MWSTEVIVVVFQVFPFLLPTSNGCNRVFWLQLDSWSVILNGSVEVTYPDSRTEILCMGNSFGVSPTMEKEYMKGIMKTKVDDCQVGSGCKWLMTWLVHCCCPSGSLGQYLTLEIKLCSILTRMNVFIVKDESTGPSLRFCLNVRVIICSEPPCVPECSCLVSVG